MQKGSVVRLDDNTVEDFDFSVRKQTRHVILKTTSVHGNMVVVASGRELPVAYFPFPYPVLLTFGGGFI